MSWWRSLLGLPEQEAPKPCPCADTAVAKKGEGAVAANKAFVCRNFDKYPECIQQYFKNADEISAYEREIETLDRAVNSYFHKMNELIDLTKESRDAGFRLHGVHKILGDYDSRMQLAYARLTSMPDVSNLRRENCRLEALAKAEGWTLWQGTGGIHWNKKGVFEDGYGYYTVR